MSPPVRVIALCAAVAVAAAVVVLPASDAEASGADSGAEQSLLDLMDRDRGTYGRHRYRVCADLRDIARNWSARMARDQTLSHNPHRSSQTQGSNGTAENVAYSSEGVRRVHSMFMNSSGHRGNILSSRYRDVGVGVERRGNMLWVTQVFRDPDGSAHCKQIPQDQRIVRACPPGTVPASSFRDIRGNGHRDAIDCGVWWGVAAGRSGSSYAPSHSLNRGQMASFIARLITRSGGSLPDGNDQGFSDVRGTTHERNINRLAAAGIVQGTGGSRYEPNARVSRAQMATFIVNAYEHATDETLQYSRDHFGDDNGSVHESAINKAAEANIVAGHGGGRYAPNESVRRGQLASFLARSLDRKVHRGHTNRPG
jgi:hypothetical protein